LHSVGRWVAIAGVAALSLIAVAGFTLAIYAAWLFHDLPDAAQLAEYHPPTSTRVFAWDGTLIGEFGRERRIFVPYDQMPPMLTKAFLAAEDRKFFEHGGIDVAGLGRAMTRDLLNVVRGRRLQGGSTITQQVAKNVLLTNEHSFGRKIKEAILARRLEQILPKKRILELYLNEIWLGYRSYGVGAAAFNYFGKPLNELSVAEMAYLASLPKGPSNYDPIKRRNEAIRRRDWVLAQMADEGFITKAQAIEAMKEDLKVQLRPERAHYHDADYFMEEVRERAMAVVGPKADDGGLYIRTTLDSRLQTLARVALMKGLEAYDHRHGWRGAIQQIKIAPGWEKAALAKAPASERRTWKPAVIDRIAGGVHVLLPSGGGGDLDGADVAWAKAGKGLNVGDLVFVEPKDGQPHSFNLRQTPIVNGALVAVDPRNGRVQALVGGYSFSLSKFNRATQAMRQPGSSFKPFVYATALENGFTPASIVLDAPIQLTGANGQVWSPENYEHDSAGPSPFRNGLVYSRNQMTVRIAEKVGMKKIREAAVNAGVVNDMAPVLAMALGAGETTPFRLTGAYSAFANGGRRIDPHVIEVVSDRQGAPVWRADTRQCPGCDAVWTGDESPRLDALGKPIMDPVTAYSITLMLEGVTTNGTAAAVSQLGRHIAGKTGTTNEFRSAWFVGYTPSLVVGVFVGFDDNRSLGDHEAGAVTAVPIFIDFMREALKGQPDEDFKAPKTAKMVSVHGHVEAFQPGTEPRVEAPPEPDAPVPLDAAIPTAEVKPKAEAPFVGPGAAPLMVKPPAPSATKPAAPPKAPSPPPKPSGKKAA
jgi:penicillin-binding protein 1A